MEVGRDSFIHKTIEQSPKTSYLQGKDLLRCAYETTFGVFDHVQHALTQENLDVDNKRPLASIAQHSSIDTNYTDRFISISKKYIHSGIKERFDISLLDLLSLPSNYVEALFQISDQEAINEKARLVKEKKEAIKAGLLPPEYADD